MVAGSNRAPIAITTLRRESLSDLSRGRLRGWAVLGALVLAVLAALSWPDPLGVLGFLAGAGACLAGFVWVQRTLRDADPDAVETRDPATGHQD